MRVQSNTHVVATGKVGSFWGDFNRGNVADLVTTYRPDLQICHGMTVWWPRKSNKLNSSYTASHHRDTAKCTCYAKWHTARVSHMCYAHVSSRMLPCASRSLYIASEQTTYNFCSIHWSAKSMQVVDEKHRKSSMAYVRDACPLYFLLEICKYFIWKL